MPPPTATRIMAETHRLQTEDNARKLGSLETEVSSLKGDVAQIRADVRQGFSEIFTKIDRANQPKATPWGAVAVLITVLLALAAWGNAWISQAIAGVRMSSDEALRKADGNDGQIHAMLDKVMQAQIQAAETRGRTEEKLRRLEFDRLPPLDTKQAQ